VTGNGNRVREVERDHLDAARRELTPKSCPGFRPGIQTCPSIETEIRVHRNARKPIGLQGVCMVLIWLLRRR
jgi:hypothetical protein